MVTKSKSPDWGQLAIDRRDSMRWAQLILQLDNFVVLDTETTGLKDNDEVIELAIIDSAGQPVYNGLIKPRKRKSWDGAQEIHGIVPSEVKECPTLEEVWTKVKDTIRSKTIITYNAEFDTRLLKQSGADLSGLYFECAMHRYSSFVGEWADWKNEYKWQKLPTASHRAMGDCQATLAVIQRMSEGRKVGQGGIAAMEVSDLLKWIGSIAAAIFMLFLISHH